MSDEDEYSALDMVNDYECPDCGEMAALELTETEAEIVLGGDENGVLRCPFCFCDEGEEPQELELTAVAAAENLAWLQERLAAIGNTNNG